MPDPISPSDPFDPPRKTLRQTSRTRLEAVLILGGFLVIALWPRDYVQWSEIVFRALVACAALALLYCYVFRRVLKLHLHDDHFVEIGAFGEKSRRWEECGPFTSLRRENDRERWKYAVWCKDLRVGAANRERPFWRRKADDIMIFNAYGPCCDDLAALMNAYRARALARAGDAQ